MILSASAADAKPKRAGQSAHATCIVTDNNPCSGGFFGYMPSPFERAAKIAQRPAKAGTARLTRGTAPGGGDGYRGDAWLVSKARAYMGQTARQIGLSRTTLWCSAFLRYVTGAHGVDDRARSWLSKPRIAPQVGAIAVLSRGKRGGHVGIVSGFDARGNPIIVSGNHGRRVGEAAYPRHRVIAYVSAS